jgi:nitrogen regulatory protein PII
MEVLRMNLLTVILKRAELTTDICKELAEEGIHGGTIIDAQGMASIIENMDDLPIFGMLKSILADDDDHETVKVMIFVVDDDEMKKAKKVIHRVVGLDEPNTGIMFAVPVTFVEGLGA